MTNKEKLQSLSLDDLTDWLNIHGEQDCSPWIQWFDSNYCAKCEPETTVLPNYHREAECAFCENHNYCRFLGESVDIMDGRTVIKMWLEEQANEDGVNEDGV